MAKNRITEKRFFNRATPTSSKDLEAFRDQVLKSLNLTIGVSQTKIASDPVEGNFPTPGTAKNYLTPSEPVEYPIFYFDLLLPIPFSDKEDRPVHIILKGYTERFVLTLEFHANSAAPKKRTKQSRVIAELLISNLARESCNAPLKEIQTFALALSGGGFRATLYHLGILKFLIDSGLIKSVSTIVSVSGGSILAAHIAQNWSKLCSLPDSLSRDGEAKNTRNNDQEFSEIVAPIIQMAERGIRERIVVKSFFRWFTTCLFFLYPCCAFLKKIIIWLADRLSFQHFELFKKYKLRRKHFSRNSPTYWLDHYYRKHLFPDSDKNRLDTLNSPVDPNCPVEPPEVFLLATALKSGSLCSFSRKGLLLQHPNERGVEMNESSFIPTRSLPLSLAITSSSAFPGLFTPVHLSLEESTPLGNRPWEDYLSDGGIFDNQGIRKIVWLKTSSNLKGISSFSHVFLSDAGAPFEVEYDSHYKKLWKLLLRTPDIWMQRISSLEKDSSREALQKAGISSPSAPPNPDFPNDGLLLEANIATKLAFQKNFTIHPDYQALLPSIRTDFDHFGKIEIEALLRHGYATARAALSPAFCNSDESYPNEAFGFSAEELYSLESSWTPTEPNPTLIRDKGANTESKLRAAQDRHIATWRSCFVFPEIIYALLGILLVISPAGWIFWKNKAVEAKLTAVEEEKTTVEAESNTVKRERDDKIGAIDILKKNKISPTNELQKAVARAEQRSAIEVVEIINEQTTKAPSTARPFSGSLDIKYYDLARFRGSEESSSEAYQQKIRVLKEAELTGGTAEPLNIKIWPLEMPEGSIDQNDPTYSILITTRNFKFTSLKPDLKSRFTLQLFATCRDLKSQIKFQGTQISTANAIDKSESNKPSSAAMFSCELKFDKPPISTTGSSNSLLLKGKIIDPVLGILGEVVIEAQPEPSKTQ